MFAQTTLFDASVDLNDIAGSDGFLFVRNGIGYAGRGVAQRVAMSQVEQVLRDIDHQNTTGIDVSPMAFGVIPSVLRPLSFITFSN